MVTPTSTAGPFNLRASQAVALTPVYLSADLRGEFTGRVPEREPACLRKKKTIGVHGQHKVPRPSALSTPTKMKPSALFFLLLPVAAAAICRTFPGDRHWPTAHDWAVLNKTVSGRLIPTIPIGAVCHDPTYSSAGCSAVKAGWHNPSFQYAPLRAITSPANPAAMNPPPPSWRHYGPTGRATHGPPPPPRVCWETTYATRSTCEVLTT
jgi:hypothetical protein